MTNQELYKRGNIPSKKEQSRANLQPSTSKPGCHFGRIWCISDQNRLKEEKQKKEKKQNGCKMLFYQAACQQCQPFTKWRP